MKFFCSSFMGFLVFDSYCLYDVRVIVVGGLGECCFKLYFFFYMDWVFVGLGRVFVFLGDERWVY